MHNGLTYIFQSLLSIHANWKIVGSNFLGKLKIDGNLVVKSQVPPRSGSVALRQLNHIHQKRPWSSFWKKKTWNMKNLKNESELGDIYHLFTDQ